jgi:hypothetical protein
MPRLLWLTLFFVVVTSLGCSGQPSSHSAGTTTQDPAGAKARASDNAPPPPKAPPK